MGCWSGAQGLAAGKRQAPAGKPAQSGRAAGKEANETARDSPVLIRYADDVVALCHSRQQALEVQARLAGWLAPRGLAINEDKTRVVTLDEGL